VKAAAPKLNSEGGLTAPERLVIAAKAHLVRPLMIA
jgi:hypothetical protein